MLSMEGNANWGAKIVEEKDGYRIYRPSKYFRWLKLFTSTWLLSKVFDFASFAKDSPKTFAGIVASANYVKQLVVQNNISIVSAYHVLSAGLASALVCRELSIPLVTSVFGEIYAQPEFHSKRLAEVKCVIDVSKKLLSCSKHCALSYELLDLHPEVEAVYYGIDTQMFSPDKSPEIVRKKLGIGIKDKVILFIGRLVKEMGLLVLLDAIPKVLAEIENTKFVIVGKSGELLPGARDLSSRYPKNVFVIVDAPFEELPFYYAAATLAVIPSINERACLGLAIAEAMATGKPAIVSNIGGGPEVIVNGKTGSLIPPNDSEALAIEICRVLATGEDVLKEMGRLSRERAVSIFDKETTNRRMEEIFEKALT